MMLAKRIFPRYLIQNFQQKVHIEGLERHELKLKDASLGGLGIIAHQDIDYPETLNITVTFAKFSYTVRGRLAWKKWNEETRTSRIGIELYFYEKKLLQTYLMFIKSLHQLRLKRIATQGKNL